MIMSEIQQQISDLKKEFYDLAIQTREDINALVSKFETFSILLCEKRFTTEEILKIINIWHKNQVCTFSYFASAILVLLRSK